MEHPVEPCEEASWSLQKMYSQEQLSRAFAIWFDVNIPESLFHVSKHVCLSSRDNAGSDIDVWWSQLEEAPPYIHRSCYVKHIL